MSTPLFKFLSLPTPPQVPLPCLLNNPATINNHSSFLQPSLNISPNTFFPFIDFLISDDTNLKSYLYSVGQDQNFDISYLGVITNLKCCCTEI